MSEVRNSLAIGELLNDQVRAALSDIITAANRKKERNRARRKRKRARKLAQRAGDK
jgi:hypothetical protein